MNILVAMLFNNNAVKLSLPHRVNYLHWHQLHYTLRSRKRFGLTMIKSFKHKGLENFYLKGHTAKIQPAHEKRLRMILVRLVSIHKSEDMKLPGFDFPALKGDLKGFYSVSVNKNWRIIFKFDGTHAFDVDYIDYH